MTIELNVPSMSCQHCVTSITNEVSQVQGVQHVMVDLGTKKVSVEASQNVTADDIVAAINEAGYEDAAVLN